MGCAPSKDGDGMKVASSRRSTPNSTPTRASNGSKSIVREAVDSGSYLKMASYKPDPRCPLTERQLYSITKSWKAINREMVSTAVNMFVRLLEDDGIRSFFSKFKSHQTLAELRASRMFQDHAIMVITVIDEVIANLDDMDYVISLLKSTGESHSVMFKNFQPDFLWNVEDAFLLAVKETLGDRFTISIENIYTIIIRYILQSLHDAFTGHRKTMLANDKSDGSTPTKPNDKQDKLNISSRIQMMRINGRQGNNKKEQADIQNGEID